MLPAVATAGTSGDMGGIVTDARTGAPVAGARVEARSGSDERVTTTDSRGHFIFFNLQPDTYTLSVVKAGYVSRSAPGYEVEADQIQQYDLKLTESRGSDSGSDGGSPPGS